MRLWPHVVAHAKRASILLRGARKDELAIDNVLQGGSCVCLERGYTR